MCEHIFSYEEGVDESWLNYEPKYPDFDILIFTYCPLCGERLELEVLSDSDSK
jgi:hypothetical protein